MPVTINHGIASTQRGAERVARLLRSGLDPDQPVIGLEWSVRQLAAHLASGAIAYRELAEGAPSPYESLDDRVATNQRRLEGELGADLAALADTIDEEVGKMLAQVRLRREGDMMAWHAGITMPVPAFLGAATAEFMFHGLDLARTVKAPWPMDRRDAFPAVDFFNAVTPHVVDRRTAAGVDAIVEVRYRGHETATFAFDDGRLTVTTGRAERPHVRMSVDPVAFLMVGYRRASLPRVVLTGGALAWGRKPWLAFRFPGWFQAP